MLAARAEQHDEIARRVSVSRPLVTLWRNGQRTPRLANRRLLKSRYGIPIEAWDEPPDAPSEWGEAAATGHLQMLESLAQKTREEIATSATATTLERLKLGGELAKLLGEIRRLKGEDLTEPDLVAHPKWITLRDELRAALAAYPDARAAVIAIMERAEAKSA